MSTYYNKTGSSPSIFSRLLTVLPSGLAAHIQRLWDQQAYSQGSKHSGTTSQTRINWNLQRLLFLPNVLACIWILLLLWGERWVFQTSIESCAWGKWEKWPKGATPHHLVLLADPQLIDPHTYPGRPWPLSSLTFLHTDNYLKRNYIQLQKQLHPDTIFFLGDLFDGGREWQTATGNTVDPSWANGQRPSGEAAYLKTWGKRYGEDFWLHEYDRFGRIFYKFWNLAGIEPGPGQRGRKIISTLPGNHDLGFGDKIKIPIRNRFETYFGEGNRVDVIANHTFVSVDAVSWAARSGEHSTQALIKPVTDFLEGVQATKRKAVARELDYQNGRWELSKFTHTVQQAQGANYKDTPQLDPGAGSKEFPTILLTHVPLYRHPGHPCGPNREHWPPTPPPKGQMTAVNPDHRNAISISGGWQYQNVLTEDDSVKLVSSIGNVGLVFSGDDHDYCEITHPANKNNAKEITVKSISWAMGVRKPGFVMLSMWNPQHSADVKQTVQTHLCLQPDQLGIFTRYVILIAISVLAIIVRTILVPVLQLEPFSREAPRESEASILPISTKHRRDRANTASTSSNALNGLVPRSTSSRTRSVSPADGYGLPPKEVRFAEEPWNEDGKNRIGKGVGAETGLGFVWREVRVSVLRVLYVAVVTYLYLIYFG